MRELDCDFCGAAAAGAYEVGPAPPDRSPSDRRRLVLCDDCRATLADAIQPLLDRLAVAEGDGPVEADGHGRDTPTEGGEATDGRDAADPLDGSHEPAERTVSEPDGGDGAAASGEVAPETAKTTPAPGSERDEHAAGTPESAGDESTTADETVGDGSTTADETTRGDDTGAVEPPAEEPPQFRKVVRLLNNRSFPVERGEFVELAASAYDLEESAVAESLAYAVDRGVLAVEDGEIVRG